MPNYKNTYPMVLNGVYLGMISLRSDVVRYFGIPEATTAEKAFGKYSGSIAAHQRTIRTNRLDDATGTRTIDVVKKNGISRERGKPAKNRGGRPFKIPTQLVNRPGATASTNPAGTIIRPETVVYTTIRFPNAASVGEVSAWLHQKLVSKKPESFQSPSGKTYSVSPLTSGAVVSGGGDTTP
jgi:hypothetical protein